MTNNARMDSQGKTLPGFTADGLLPAGDYVLSLDELRRSQLVTGPEDLMAYPHWDEAWRGKLVENLAVLVRQLWQVGITEVRIVCRGQGTSE